MKQITLWEASLLCWHCGDATKSQQGTLNTLAKSGFVHAMSIIDLTLWQLELEMVRLMPIMVSVATVQRGHM